MEENEKTWIDDLKEEIDTNIKPNNHKREITGAKLNTTLKDMVDEISENIPQSLGDLESDSTHQTVTEKEKDDWSSGAAIFTEAQEFSDAQRNQALANVSNQTANSTTGKMGYVVLQPEKQDDATTSFAAQIANKPNTIFEIRDVFDLNNETVEIPANCTLKFNGGLIDNGALIGNNTSIEAGSVKIFGTNLVLYKPSFKSSSLSWANISNRTVNLSNSHGRLWKMTVDKSSVGYRRGSNKNEAGVFSSLNGDDIDIINFDNELVLDKNPGSFYEISLSTFNGKTSVNVEMQSTLNGSIDLTIYRDGNNFVIPDYGNFAFFDSNDANDDPSEHYIPYGTTIDLSQDTVYVSYLARCVVDTGSTFACDAKLSWFIGDNYTKSIGDSLVTDQSKEMQSAFDSTMNIISDIFGVINIGSTLYLEIQKVIDFGGTYKLVSASTAQLKTRIDCTVLAVSANVDMVIQRATVDWHGGLLTAQKCVDHSRNIWTIDGNYTSSQSTITTSMRGYTKIGSDYSLSTFAGIKVDSSGTGGGGVFSSDNTFNCYIACCKYGLHSHRGIGSFYINTCTVNLTVDRYYESVHIDGSFGASNINLRLQASPVVPLAEVDNYRNAYIITSRAAVSIVTWDFSDTKTSAAYQKPYRKILVQGNGTIITGQSQYPGTLMENTKNYGYAGHDPRLLFLEGGNSLFHPALNDIFIGINQYILNNTNSYLKVFEVKDESNLNLDTYYGKSSENTDIDEIANMVNQDSVFIKLAMFSSAGLTYVGANDVRVTLGKNQYIEFYLESVTGYYLTNGIDALFGWMKVDEMNANFDKVMLVLNGNSSYVSKKAYEPFMTISTVSALSNVSSILLRFYFNDSENKYGSPVEVDNVCPLSKLYAFSDDSRKAWNWSTQNVVRTNTLPTSPKPRGGEMIFHSASGVNIPAWYSPEGKWIDSEGFQPIRKIGTSEQRPTLGSGDDGYKYYDKTLKKWIMWYYTDSIHNGWVNLDGTPLDGVTYSVSKSDSITLSSGTPSNVADGKLFMTTIESCDDFNFIKVIMGGVDITSFVYNSTTHVIYIGGVSGNIVINDNTYLRFTNVNDNISDPTSTVQLVANGTAPSLNLEVYTNTNPQWTAYSVGDTITLANTNDFVMFRGVNGRLATGSTNYNGFVMSGSIAASGDITSLINGIGGDITQSYDSIFQSLFKNCASMVTMPNCPITSFNKQAVMSETFRGCTGLTQARYMPATGMNAGCYTSMFYGCSNITSHHFATLNNSSNVFTLNSSCTSFIIDAVEPPTIGSNTISGLKSDCTIYVPDDSVDAYKAADYWSERKDYIKGISERPNI